MWWYCDIWKERFYEANMAFMTKYTLFWDNLELYSIWQAIVRLKIEFSCHFLSVSRTEYKYCSDMAIYERSGSMKVVWHSWQKVHCFETIWSFLAFDKASFVWKSSFYVIFEAILGQNHQYCSDMAIYEWSCSMKLIWYSS